MRGLVYIAGPMTIGPREKNMRRAFEVAEDLWAMGYAPFCPQLSFVYDDMFKHTWEEWLEYDEFIITLCKAVFRLDGESKGADREVVFAQEHNIPVFYTTSAFEIWSRHGDVRHNV